MFKKHFLRYYLENQAYKNNIVKGGQSYAIIDCRKNIIR